MRAQRTDLYPAVSDSRLEGTNVEEGRRLIEESGLGFVTAAGMKDAAEKVVRLAAKAG